MNAYQKFKAECIKEVADQGADLKLKDFSREWINAANARKYSYHFEWLGRPVIQYPQDIVGRQN